VTLEEIVLDRSEGTRYRVTLARAADPAAPVVIVAPAMGGARQRDAYRPSCVYR